MFHHSVKAVKSEVMYDTEKEIKNDTASKDKVNSIFTMFYSIFSIF